MSRSEAPAGTAGYGEHAAALVAQYEGLSFAHVHRKTLHLMPPPPARVLDVGAGSGRDAAHLAGLGHPVVAVEPTAELRRRGQALHATAGIGWIDDALPDLAAVRALGQRFDVVLLSAVWMHLDAAERARAMPVVAELLAPNGLVVMTLRHGPVPPGRRMFEVTPAETCGLAAAQRLVVVYQGEGEDSQGRAGVTWSRLAFRAPA